MRFVDTNVLLYSISDDPAEHAKAEIARWLLTEPDLAVSVQVLQEFYVQSTRTTRSGAVTPERGTALVESYQRFPVAVTTPAVMRAAIAMSRRFSLSYWDAAIIEAARSLGCDVVLSEDMGHAQDYDGVRVVNPFVEQP